MSIYSPITPIIVNLNPSKMKPKILIKQREIASSLDWEGQNIDIESLSKGKLFISKQDGTPYFKAKNDVHLTPIPK